MTQNISGKQFVAAIFADLVTLVFFILALVFSVQHLPAFAQLASHIALFILIGDTAIKMARKSSVDAKYLPEFAISVSALTGSITAFYLHMIGQQTAADAVGAVIILLLLCMIVLRLFPRK